MKIKIWRFLTREGEQARDFVITCVREKHLNLEESILKTKRFFRSKRYKNKTFFALAIFWLYQALKGIKINYPPKDTKKYKEFREFIEKAEKDIKEKGEISEETAEIINKLFWKK